MPHSTTPIPSGLPLRAGAVGISRDHQRQSFRGAIAFKRSNVGCRQSATNVTRPAVNEGVSGAEDFR